MSTERSDAALIHRWLIAHDACPQGVAWARGHASFDSLWRQCRTIEWMIWALGRAEYRAEKPLRRFAVSCVRRHQALWSGTPIDQIVAIAEAAAAGNAGPTDLLAAWRGGRQALEARARSSEWSAARAAAGNAAVGCARPDPLDAAHTAALECLKALEWQSPAPEAGVAEQVWQTDELRRHIGDEVDEIVRMVRARDATRGPSGAKGAT